MPSVQENQTPKADTRGSSRPHAAQATLAELATHLDTDLKKGLSPQKARARLVNREDHSLFEAPTPKLWPCVKSALTEPVMWLFLVVCVVAMFFNRMEIGLFSAALMLLHGGVCVYLKYKTLRLHHKLQAYDIPLTRVIRNGRLMRVRGDRIVPGDVILLRRGDVVPADARLITAKGLTVLEKSLNGDEKARENLLLTKDAKVIPDVIPRRHSPEHMVYAGGLVKKGQGRALVVAVASKTHLGGLMARVPASHAYALPPYLEKLKKCLSTVNLIMAVAAIPLTAVGILTKGGRYEFLDIFMSALALSVLTLTEHTVMLGMYSYASVTAMAHEDADRANTADIRTPETLEKLCHMDHLILLGTAALHDGEWHPAFAFGGGEYHTFDHGEASPAVVALTEKLYLLSLGQTDRLKSGAYRDFPSLEASVKYICERVSPDTDALLLRLEGVEAEGDAVHIRIRHERAKTLYLTEDLSAISHCHMASSDEGEIPMDEDVETHWQHALQKALSQGLRVQLLVSESEEGRCAEGFVAFRVGFCRKTKGCIKGMEDVGIRVTSFLRDYIREDKKALSEAGLTDMAPSCDLSRLSMTPDYTKLTADGVRSFVNATTEDVLDYMDAIHRSGGCVGVLSVERIDLPLLEAADVAFTCTPLSLAETLWEDVPLMSGAPGAEADGTPDSDTASDLCRRAAHVTVRRCGEYGGGVCGVRRARLAAGQLMRGLRLSLRFVLLSQVLRILMLSLPLVSGTACLSAPALLLSGLVMDALAVLCLAKCDMTESGSAPVEVPPAQALKAPHLLFKTEWIMTAVSTAIPFGIALATRLIKGSAYGDMAYFVALSLLLTQIMIFATGHMPKRKRSGFFVLVLMVCAYAGLLAVSLASGLHIFWSLLLPLIQPILWLISYAVLRKLKLISYAA